MNDNTILRIKVPAHLYESVKEQLTLKENKKKLQEEISGTQEELKDFYLRVKKIEGEGTDLESAVQYALFDMNNPDAAKELSSMNEAKKAGHNYGAGMEVVKEKKMKAPKDGMKKIEEEKVEETNETMEKKVHTLDELKAAKAKLDKKIQEMEVTSEEKVEESVFADPNFWAGIGGLLLGAVPFIKLKYDQWKSAKTPEEKDKLEKELADAIQKKMSGGM